MTLAPVSTQNHSVNFFQNLPCDIVYNICSRLVRLNEIHSLLLTNWNFNKLIPTINSLWQDLVVSHFQFPLKTISNSLPAFDLYKRLKNVRTGNYELHFLEGHQDWVRCIATQNGLCFSGSGDGTIKIWDAKSKKELHMFKGYQGCAVQCLAVQGNILIAGFPDGIIKFWDLNAKIE